MQPLVTTVTASNPLLPLGDEEFSQLVDQMFSPSSLTTTRVALGVSGGPDSMALAICAQRWASARGVRLKAFIVDHSLRASSAAEAALTVARLLVLGIDAEILLWTHDPVISKVHAVARKARYQLLIEACRVQNFASLWLAHHREDQAETILMRLAKGSGIDGLAGMEPKSHAGAILLLRPFLSISKARLLATCEQASVSFVTDPSNEAARYARGRLRKVMPLLSDEGFTIDRLLDLGHRAGEAKRALDSVRDHFLATCVVLEEAGFLRLDYAAFKELPKAIAERALTVCLQTLHREDYPPEHASLELLYAELVRSPAMAPRTLHGCHIARTEKAITLTREISNIADVSINAGEVALWDGRWKIDLLSCRSPATFSVRALGQPERKDIERCAPGLLRQVPSARARAALPSLWQGGELWAAPVMKADDLAMCRFTLLTSWPKNGAASETQID